MTSKRGNDIRKAIAALKVSHPMRLSKDGPGLRPPEPTHVEVSQNEVPPHGASLLEQPRLEAPPPELPQAEVPHNEKPSIEIPHSEAPFVEAPQSKVPRKKVPQIQHSQLGKAETELPRNEAPPFEDRPTSGFFKLSNDVFRDSRLRKLTGDSFRLFLWLSTRAWRFPDSNGEVRASVSFMENGTGMGHATVSRSLKSLKEGGLVSLIETDFKRGNLWRVSTVALTGGPPEPRKKVPENEVTQLKIPQIEAAACSNRAGDTLDSSGLPPQIEREFKNHKNLRNLSQEDLTALVAHLAVVGAPSKRRTEAARLDSLLGAYPVPRLLAALEFLKSHGTLSGEKCHSPFSYLAMAGDEVMKRVGGKAWVEVRPEKVPVTEPTDTREREEFLKRFDSDLLPSERDKYIASFIEREYPHGFLPPQRVIRTLAAARWMREERKPLLRAV